MFGFCNLINFLLFHFSSEVLLLLFCFTFVLLHFFSFWRKRIIIEAHYFLTHFQPMFHFYTTWQHQKISVFLMFSVGYRSRTLVKNGLMTRVYWKVLWKHFGKWIIMDGMGFSSTLQSFSKKDSMLKLV